MTTPATPNGVKKRAFASSPQSSGKKKFKQSSLMSFFGKQNKRATSTPIKTARTQSLFVENEDGSDNDTGFITAADDSHMVIDEVQKSETPATDATMSKEKDLSSPEPITTTTPDGRKERRVNYAEDSDESDRDENDKNFSHLRRKKRLPLSDEEDEFKPDEAQNASSDDDESVVGDKEDEGSAIDGLLGSGQGKNDIGDDADDDELVLALSKKLKKRVNSPPRPKPAKKIAPRNSIGKHSSFNKENEERYQWLVHERDAQGHSKDDESYDPRTLYIPDSAWSKFTPFERQYWEIKAKMWDCIVFFKKGKFFELYEKDAFLANHLFDLKLAGGGRANMQLAGIPEMSFDHWASQFISHGFKVAKVDQRESMLAKEMREGNKGIVKRELQYVLTSGTLTDLKMLQTDQATFCLSIREETPEIYGGIQDEESDVKTARVFGVSFIDTATGQINLLEFNDDSDCTNLDTLLSQVRPKEIITEKNNLSSLAHKIVKFNSQPQALFNYLKPNVEFYDFNKTFDELVSPDHKYFKSIDDWPEVLKRYYEKGKQAGFSAFGGLISYLKWLKLDESMISMGNITEYDPIKSQVALVLDGVTLQNLEIFSNSFDGTDRGTLFRLINRGITPMGKRLLRKWLMHPLLNKRDIEQRLDSIDQLLSELEVREPLENYLGQLPDLERLTARIHSGNLKIKDFNTVIEGFETIVTLLSKVEEFDMRGALGMFIKQVPKELSDDVAAWASAFDRKRATSENIIIPQPGVEPEFDQSLDDIKSIEDTLNELLKGYKRQFKTSNIAYKDSGKEIYTIELPMSVVKLVPSEWIQMGANKSSKRYYSPEVAELARSMAEAKERHKALEDSLKGRLYQKFDAQFQKTWLPTINAISSIDCLLSLARTSEALGFPCCRPKFVDEIDEPTGAKLQGHLKFKQLRHPCFNLGSTASKNFIPNDVELGGEKTSLALLTGANAAGKSTVLRMTCIAVILAQIGCYVPAEEATLCPVDRIMTRLGASDNIMQGKSTFFVELSETKKILDMATNRSLLVVDELGRGGSSSDGYAIAESVLHHVATHIQSLGFFATHYAALGEDFRFHPNVRPLKMDILVDEDSQTITFLYKLVPGKSEGSFGMHVASMCGISKSIVDGAQLAADQLEHTSILTKERQGEKGLKKNQIPDGLLSDFIRLTAGNGLTNSKLGSGEGVGIYDRFVKTKVLEILFKMTDEL
ncbi:LAMI_0H14972g1_1 [Lachancea mirantina]|uniref:DNA mismatch repair protein n=1 Tax=Lachancea mirantina TaxID=1230905 RepID=A0A1G4KIG5_9SACH|nr:LAMI_0H14972g1_1 [Lachancea mirantina]